MSVREILMTLSDGPRKRQVEDAAHSQDEAQRHLAQAIGMAQVAELHMTSLLSSITNEPGDGLSYDPGTCTIYREAVERSPDEEGAS